MLRSLDHMLSCTVSTTDGALGRLRDVYYDDRFWTVRYLVVGDIDEQAAVRLVSPLAVDRVSDEPQQIFLSLDRDRVLEAPDVGEKRPVSLQAEMVYHDYFGWPYYWQEGPYARGAWPSPPGLPPTPDVAIPPPAGTRIEGGEEAEGRAQENAEASHHLRSADETIGYHVQALNGEIGHIDDFLIDERSWLVTSVVIDTRNWWFGKKVAVPSHEFTRIDWGSRLIFVDETHEQIQATREFDATTLPREK